MLTIAKIIKKYDILAKKSFGQNFLMNEEICQKIANLGKLNPEDYVIEVGPGLGSLTRFLCLTGANVQVVEKDSSFISILKEEYSNFTNLNVIEGDALKINFAELIGQKPFKVLANLPYNVGTEILTNFITMQNRPQIMVFMLQKEVVERITAKPNTKNYGRLSILCQAFYNCYSAFDVSKGNFNPQPNVLSAVVVLTSKNVNYNAVKLGMLTERMFSNRRKMLKNALHSLNIHNSPFEQKRAEDLTIEEYLSLL